MIILKENEKNELTQAFESLASHIPSKERTMEYLYGVLNVMELYEDHGSRVAPEIEAMVQDVIK